jgi:uncharacterized protein (DUF2062 family)
MTDSEREAIARAAAQPLVAAMTPMGCIMGLIAALFWLVIIGLLMFCAWIWSIK